MNFEELIRKREACRKFSDKEISDSDIAKILESGRCAPTAKNMQPYKIMVIKSNEGIKKIDECSPCRYNAPVVLLVCGNEDEAWHNENEDYPTTYVDAAIVTTHMMLEATNLGLDTTWIRYFDSNKLRKEFNLSDNLTPICLLNLGYKSPDYGGNPNHKIRKDINELVKYL